MKLWQHHHVASRSDPRAVEMPHQDTDSIFILFKGGRLPAWHQLSTQDQDEFTQMHVNLMLSVGQQHGMRRLEGFHLIGPQDAWQRLWLIEFPSLQGAEAWIQAEMTPPYGLYGYYQYHFTRRLTVEPFSAWGIEPAAVTVPLDADPYTVPELQIDRGSVVVLMFARYRPEAEALTPQQRGDAQHVLLMQNIARKHNLIRLDAFQLLTPQNDWHRVWIIELPTLEAAEAWVEGEESLPHGMHTQRTIYLSRKWSPEYFASWATTH